LIALSDDELLDRYCVVVDHRAFETEVVSDFATFLDEGDVLTASGEEVPGNFSISLDGEQYYVPLQSEPSDRYVTICSLAVILSDKYEFRLLGETRGDDTHLFLLLPIAMWEEIDRDHEEWSERFIPIELGVDEFSESNHPTRRHVERQHETRGNPTSRAGL
jgi:hypothetical protein